ncbi:MAG: DUF167 domain-containing protein [Candidatus Peribacteraceae bacterium]|nr:DUF167 domain-containing protein [Candidatus Peribacteraceae bacterium]MDD5074515.1 DUF167 domain-containing protein [Candidatus Peribacteraceae bacterium]
MFDESKKLLAEKGEVSFDVRVHPGASRTRVKEVMADGTIKLDIAAVPEDGKANEELVRFLADEFDVPKSHVEILKGHTAKTKVVRIRQ